MCGGASGVLYHAFKTYVTNTRNGERGTGNGERGTGNGERGTGNGERGTGNGERGTGNGERGTGNGERETGNGERGTGNGERGTGNGERGTGNGERGTGNGERETGNGERGTGVWELLYIGNPPDNLKWRTKGTKTFSFPEPRILLVFRPLVKGNEDSGNEIGTKREQLRKCHGCKGEFLLAVHPDNCTSPIAGLQGHPMKNIDRSHSIKRR